MLCVSHYGTIKLVNKVSMEFDSDVLMCSNSLSDVLEVSSLVLKLHCTLYINIDAFVNDLAQLDESMFDFAYTDEVVDEECHDAGSECSPDSTSAFEIEGTDADINDVADMDDVDDMDNTEFIRDLNKMKYLMQQSVIQLLVHV